MLSKFSFITSRRNFAHHARGLGVGGAGLLHFDGVFAEVGHSQVAQEQPAVAVRIGAHAAFALGREFGQFRFEPPIGIEEFLRLVALHPLLEDFDVLRLLVHLAHRHLMRAPRILGALAVDFLRAGPALRRAKNDHRPARALDAALPTRARGGLNAPNFRDGLVERGGHQLVHLRRLAAFDEDRRVAVAAEQLIQFLVADAREHAGVGNLVAVEMQNRQHRAVRRRVEKLVRMPARRERPGLRFAIADDGGHDEIGVVERRAIRVTERVTEFAPFVNGAGRFGRNVTRDAAGEGELFEQLLHPFLVLRDVRINFAVGSFEPRVGHDARSAVTGADDVDHVHVALLDDAIEMHVDEVQSRRRAPMADQARLHVFFLQRLLEERIVVEICLANRQVIRRAPPRVDFAEQDGFKRAFRGGRGAAGVGELFHSGAAHSAAGLREALFHGVVLWVLL